MHRPLVATLLGCLVVLAGCVHVHEHEHRHKHKHARHEAGPPPWAPAHGYRHKHQHGVNLHFDAHLGVYLVVGHPHVYFHDGHYFRRVHSRWERCGDWRKGRWKSVDAKRVPRGLVKHFEGKGPKHGKGKKGKGKGYGHGPAKQRGWD